MNLSLEELKTATSALPTPDRAELAQFLLHTLEPTDENVDDVEAEWRALAEQRMADVHAGKVVGVPVDQIWIRPEGPNQ